MATAIRRVWETSDGRLFRDRAVAKRHDAWLELVAVADRMMVELGLPVPGDGDDPTVESLAHQILLNTDDIQRILRAKPEKAE